MEKNKNTKDLSQRNESDPKGEFQGVMFITRKGGGFVRIIDREEDVEVQKERLGTALHGDEVKIEIVHAPHMRRVQGKVTEIISRSKFVYSGTIQKSEDMIVLSTDDKKMQELIKIAGAKSEDIGMKAAVRISSWEKPITGNIIKILGKPGIHETEMNAILYDKGFASDFPPDVKAEAEKIVAESHHDIESEGRRDFRKSNTYTIDPADAKDFDDAISISPLGGDMYEIGVHIADVAHYVVPGSALDREAQKRGFSIYMVDRTIPMLPEELSNDLCSLNPQEDKRVFSAVFKISLDGVVSDRWFGRGIIHSNKRYSYEEAEEDLKNGSNPDITTLSKIATQLRKAKSANGAIDFDTDEIKVELDKDGKPIRFYKKEKLETHEIVEDYMLLANREVAKFLFGKTKTSSDSKNAFLYRVHDKPNVEKIQDLSTFLHVLGFELETNHGAVTARNIQKLLKEIGGSSQEPLIKTAVLRSMAKATYSTTNIGHFGLAFEFYTHFTSPIRRYPDVLVHRSLARVLAEKRVSEGELRTLAEVAATSTEKEIAAAEAERASLKMKQVEYMSERVGQQFSGKITGVTEWGVYIAELETGAEGMARLADISPNMEFLQKQYTVKDTQSGKKISLGDIVTFVVAAANVADRELDFKIVPSK